MLETRNLQVSYQDKLILDQVSLTFKPAALTAIIGPNGAGKSTLLKAILDMLPHQGESLLDKEATKKQLKRLAYVEQKTKIDLNFPIRTKDCVALGLYPRLSLGQRLDKKAKQEVMHALELVGLEECADDQISQLSGGQFQRMLLARCLLQDADYLLLDEPFVGIDMVSEAIIIQLLKDLAQQGKTILIVHHDLSKVRDYFDQVVILNQRVIAAGSVQTCFTKEMIKKAFQRCLPEEVFE